MQKSKTLRYYKIFAVITFGTGLFLHTSRILFGSEFFLSHILTLDNDKLFSIPMTLAAIFAWLAFKAIDFKTKGRKIIYGVIAVYMNVSVPVHLKSWFTDDMKQLEVFPQSYSYIILPVLLAMLLFTLTLQPKNN